MTPEQREKVEDIRRWWVGDKVTAANIGTVLPFLLSLVTELDANGTELQSLLHQAIDGKLGWQEPEEMIAKFRELDVLRERVEKARQECDRFINDTGYHPFMRQVAISLRDLLSEPPHVL